MTSGDRFYELDLRHREALHGDIGSILKIEGLVIGGEGSQCVLMLPDTEWKGWGTPVNHLDEAEWTDWLHRSDQPEILVMPAKAFHRKVRHEISGAVQQKVWMADALKCVYCGVAMGKAQLTVDHFIPVEMGGANDTSNYLTACRKCNKDKGAMNPRDFCEWRNLNYEVLADYLAARKIR
jgi:5-methylcytosine-specific restriction endonuclease McrA